MAEVIYSEVSGDNDLPGRLFDGIKFWLAQTVPQRSRFVDNVKANGGEVVLLDKLADIMIVDHARKHATPGTYSFTFIEKSIRNGVLERLEDHVVGPAPGTVRSIGSTLQASKGVRNKFTEEDDCVLWQWVHSHSQKGGGTDGNEIYKQLEAQNARHPWQSWRDRWIKYLKGRARPAFVPTNAPPTPPLDHPPTRSDIEMARKSKHKKRTFSVDDVKALLEAGESIMTILPERMDEAWEAWADSDDVKPRRPARDWQCLWENNVRPIFLKRQAKELKNDHTTTTSEEPQPPCAVGKESSSNRTRSTSRRRTSADNAARRSPFLKHDFPKGYTKSPSLPIRSPSEPYKQSGHVISRLASLEADDGNGPQLPPEVSLKATHGENESKTYLSDTEVRFTGIGKDPTRRHMMEAVHYESHAERTAKALEARPDVAVEDRYSRPSPQHSLEGAGYRRIPRFTLEKTRETSPSPLAPALALAVTPKRKRDVVDDDGLPSSSPLGLPLPRSASPKRQKRGRLQAQALEIASTPENSPRRPDLDAELQLTGRTNDAILIPDDSESGTESSESDEDAIFDDSLLGRPASPTLSSPSRTIPNTQPSPRRSTQAVFNDPTQFIDLEVPDPQGGWDEDIETPLSPEDLDPNSQLVDSPPAAVIPESQQDLPDTQALLDSRTQMPDFSIAEPDGGWDNLDLIPSSPPTMPDQHSSPPPTTKTPKAASPDPKKLRTGLYTWVQIQQTAGYPLENLIAALKATSNNLDLAKLVLKYMTRKGKGRIPSNEKGIWTEDDDEDLESTNARRIEKVQAKHGAAVCDVRLAFLHGYRQTEKTT